MTAIVPEYEPTTGRLVVGRHWDGAVREAIEVRQGVEEDALRGAVVAELERRGYTVVPPGQPAPLYSDVVFYRDEVGRTFVGGETSDASAREMVRMLIEHLSEPA